MTQSNGSLPQQPTLTSFVTTDLSGITRGRAMLETEAEQQLEKGCGWVPANSALTPFDIIADPNPWGSLGDLRLKPDPASLVKVNTLPDSQMTPLAYYHSDLVQTDGAPWPTCPRTLLKDVQRQYREEFGIELMVAFEHEFTLTTEQSTTTPSFSLRSLRKIDPFGSVLMRVLEEAGAEPETFLPEYGQHQYEVTCRPCSPVQAADRAVNIREISREVASNLGYGISYSPIQQPDGVGNGVHLHVSFKDLQGKPQMYDPERPHGLAPITGSWAAGVLRHMPALCAFTAPTAVSYLRLQPHRWSAAYTSLGDRNRETSLRICPLVTMGGGDPARQYNLEYRAMDATASPHLALATVLLAGLIGIREQLATPEISDADPETLSSAESARLGIHRLPSSLSQALSVLRDDTRLLEQLPTALVDTYLCMKEEEIRICDGLNPEQLCQRYSQVY
ncbi:hypothetical protein [Oceanisphaera ostreae]|uniref:GS catalytic domain-containing protein n=1 Tax=Oceanisphaera ostreae TaxID=914151 RepID=A0ABW3KJ34_9GAMM